MESEGPSFKTDTPTAGRLLMGMLASAVRVIRPPVLLSSTSPTESFFAVACIPRATTTALRNRHVYKKHVLSAPRCREVMRRIKT